MKSKIFFLLFFIPVFLFAQSDKTSPGIRSAFYLGGGFMIPSSEMKTNSMFGNGNNMQFGFFQSFKNIKQSSGNSYHVGLEARLEYTKFKKDLRAPSSVTNLKYDNGTGTPVSIAPELNTEKKKPDAFHFLAGPSVIFVHGNYFLSPSLLFGYASVSQEKFVFSDSIVNPSDPSQNQLINFYAAGHETNNGFVFVPGIRAGFRFTNLIAAFVSADYSLGKSQSFSDKVFAASGSPNASGVYSFQQLKNGTVVNTERNSKLRALNINLNIAFILK